MQLGRVTGTVVASVKTEGLEGIKFLVVQPLDKHQEPIGKPVIAADGGVHGRPRGTGLLRCVTRGCRGPRAEVRAGRSRHRRNR